MRGTIRAATNADAPRIRQIVFAVLAEYGLRPDPDGCDKDMEDIEGSYLAGGGLFEVVETENGDLVGTVGLAPMEGGVCELRKMYLVPEARGHGWGKRLLERALDHAQRGSFRQVTLETASCLVEAIALYTRYGFRPVAAEHRASRCDQAFALDLP